MISSVLAERLRLLLTPTHCPEENGNVQPTTRPIWFFLVTSCVRISLRSASPPRRCPDRDGPWF